MVAEDSAAEKPDLTFELKSGQKMFDIDDIVRFDWDKQILELTRQSAMDFMAEFSLVGVYGRKFVLKDGLTVIYEGTLVTPLSSVAFAGPVIRSPLPDDEIKPPLFKIDGGYPRDFAKGDSRFSECLKELLQQAGVLADIDVNNPLPPIESITHGWFGEKDGLRALIEVFPETFRLRRQVRMHIHLTGSKNFDENHVFDVNATLISKDDKSRFSTKKVFPFQSTGWKNIYVLEMNPWENVEHLRGKMKPGPAELSVEVSTRKILDGKTKTYSEPIDHVKTDAINVWIEPGQPLLPKMANQVPSAIPVIRLEKTKYVLGESIRFWVGVKCLYDDVVIHEKFWDTCFLYVTRPDGTLKKESIPWPVDGMLYASWTGGWGFGKEKVQVGKYTLVFEFAKKKTEPAELIIEELDVIKKIKATFDFQRSGDISRDVRIPVILTVQNNSEHVIQFPRRGVSDAYVSIRVKRQEPPRRADFFYPIEKLKGPLKNIYNWNRDASVPPIVVKPGERFEQCLALEDAYEFWGPGQYHVTFSTTLALVVGEKNSKFAAYCPIRLPVVATEYFNIKDIQKEDTGKAKGQVKDRWKTNVQIEVERR